ncbi:MAG: PEGA domain-containing protein [Kofleriaceae bacterium]
MRAVLVSIALVAMSATPSRAEDHTSIGVVVVGDAAIQARLSVYLEHWLATHDRNVISKPLSADAINTITNCLVIDDHPCARSVVESRSKTPIVLFARAEASKDKTLVINALWIAKGHEALGERRVCEKCVGEEWHSSVDQMMEAFVQQTVEQGHIHVESDPPGLMVLFDYVQIGFTPLDKEVPTGHHRIDLMHGERHVGKKAVQIDAGDTTDVKIKAKLEDEAPVAGPSGSRLVPGIVMGAGIAAVGVGGVFLYYGALGGSDNKYVYPDSTPVGIGVLAAGVGATIIGSILFVQAGHPKSAPVASVSHDSAYLGWITSF